MENKEMMLQPTASKQGCKGNGKVEEGGTLWDVGQNYICKSNQTPYENTLDCKGEKTCTSKINK